MQELVAKFVPVADEVSRLQRDAEPDCRFFQGFSEKGHYGGRTKPSNTRQGIYAVTATGTWRWWGRQMSTTSGRVCSIISSRSLKTGTSSPTEVAARSRSSSQTAARPAPLSRIALNLLPRLWAGLGALTAEDLGHRVHQLQEAGGQLHGLVGVGGVVLIH